MNLSYHNSKTLHVVALASYRKFSKKLNDLLINMPKEPKHIAEAQKQRNKIKEKFQRYAPGKVMLQVLGTGAEGAPRSLYMFTDQSRYLFNCGEGTQRLAHEHKMKLSKLEHIFITQPIWRNIGGLPGTALTIQDVGVPEITLHGPPGLDELFAATKRFVVIKDMRIKLAECSPEVDYQDSVMTVNYVPIYKGGKMESLSEEVQNEECGSSSASSNDKETQAGYLAETVDSCTSTRTENKRRSRSRGRSRSRSRRRSGSSSSNSIIYEEDTTDYYAHEQSGRRDLQQQVPNTVIPHKTRIQNTAMCYVCRLTPKAGVLNLELCVKHGVPPGPLLGKLKSGEDVTLESGAVVRSQDVRQPDDPGPVFLIIDCPTEEYLESLCHSVVWTKYQATGTKDEDLAYVVVHFTPSSVIEHPLYREWVDKFSPSTQHIVLNEKNTCMGSEAVHRIQHKLNLLDSNLFPLLGDKGTPIANSADEDVPANKRIKTDNVCSSPEKAAETTKLIENLKMVSRPNTPDNPYVQTGTFCSFHLRPRTGLDRSAELALSPETYVEECNNIEDFSNTLHGLKQELAAKTANKTFSKYPQIVFLGTGSCIPNKTRNTSGILLRSSESTNILIDCGEGTYGQLVRLYGYQKAVEILTNLKAIYISHLHADHHIGLIGMLQGRRRALEYAGVCQNSKPMYLLAPQQIMTWLCMYDRRFEKICEEFHLVPSGDLIQARNSLLPETNGTSAKKQEMLDALDMTDVATCLVRHCPNAFGVALTHRSGFKVTYSGDTMPCDSLVALGLNSDLLIHEATMEDELAHEAITKMHSTTSQAIEIGRRMHAKRILLTHFSQRYAKLPRFNDNMCAENVGIAFDNMTVSMDQLDILPMMYLTLKTMFADDYVELENKAFKRQLRQERAQRDRSADRN